MNNRVYPRFRAGDSIELTVLSHITAEAPDLIKGLVISRSNRGMDSSVTIINSEMGTPIKRHIKIFSPLIQSIKILEKAFIYQGKKKVRRAKIYYFQEKDPKFWTIT